MDCLCTARKITQGDIALSWGCSYSFSTPFPLPLESRSLEPLLFSYVPISQAYIGLLGTAQLGVGNLLSICHKAPVLMWCIFISILGLFIPVSDSRFRIFIILFSFTSIAAFSIGFIFRPHYFLYILPVFSMLFGYSAFKFTGHFIAPFRFFILPAYITIVTFCFFYGHRDYFFVQPSKNATEMMSTGSPFVISEDVAHYIENHSAPNDRICLVGAEPQIFFLSKRKSASGYIYVYPLLDKQKYAQTMTDEFIAQSEQSKPAILVYSSKSVFENGANLDSKLYQWFTGFKQHYKLVALYAAKRDDGSMISQIDTITPVDTLPQFIPQIKVYKRVEN